MEWCGWWGYLENSFQVEAETVQQLVSGFVVVRTVAEVRQAIVAEVGLVVILHKHWQVKQIGRIHFVLVCFVVVLVHSLMFCFMLFGFQFSFDRLRPKASENSIKQNIRKKYFIKCVTLRNYTLNRQFIISFNRIVLSFFLIFKK